MQFLGKGEPCDDDGAAEPRFLKWLVPRRRPHIAIVRMDGCDWNDRRLSSMLLIVVLECRPSDFTEPIFPDDRF